MSPPATTIVAGGKDIDKNGGADAVDDDGDGDKLMYMAVVWDMTCHADANEKVAKTTPITTARVVAAEIETGVKGVKMGVKTVADDALPLYSFAVVTTESNAQMSKIHHRMPVLLSAADARRWCDVENVTPAAAWALIDAAATQQQQFYRVSDHVNRIGNKGVECVLPLAEFKKKKLAAGLGRFFTAASASPTSKSSSTSKALSSASSSSSSSVSSASSALSSTLAPLTPTRKRKAQEPATIAKIPTVVYPVEEDRIDDSIADSDSDGDGVATFATFSQEKRRTRKTE
jgi:hypothetical protein